MKNIKTKIFKRKRKINCDWNGNNDDFTPYRNLKFYLNYGMVDTKTNFLLSFKQKPMIKERIDLFTNVRAKANRKELRTLYWKNWLVFFLERQWKCRKSKTHNLFNNLFIFLDGIEEETKLTYSKFTQNCLEDGKN